MSRAFVKGKRKRREMTTLTFIPGRMEYLPDKIERWGKIRFKGDAESVRSRWAHMLVRETSRDASFARLDLVIDEYEADPSCPQ